MKLKKLTMKAFGSYGAATTIDFEDLDSGLYLIRGNTGAGKTTIFDAVVFALYGESSGGRRRLAMMHSDYVALDVPTEIELVFEHQGGIHRVQRVQRFVHHRSGDYDPAPPQATFWEAGKVPLENASRVTARITELLGLTSDQFGQIVMLAQGAFRKFLEADGNGRMGILSKIFDTSKYQAMTERLVRAESRLFSRRREDEESVRQVIQNMELPVDLSEDVRRKIQPIDPKDAERRRVLRSPTIEADLVALIRKESEQAEVLRAERTARQKASERLMAEWTSVKTQNQRLDARDAARMKMEGLEAAKDRMEEQAGRVARGGHALAVWMAEEKLEAAGAAVRDSVTREELLAENLRVCQEASASATAVAQASQNDRAEVEARVAQLEQLRGTLGDYSQLSAYERKILEKKQNVRTLRAVVEEKARAAVDQGQMLAQIAEELTSLDGIERIAAKAQIDCETAESGYLKFQETQCDVARALNLDRMLQRVLEEARRLGEEAKLAVTAHARSYRAFVDGQAGMMAKELREAIERVGEGRCPVCGIVHTEASLRTTALARPAVDACSEAAVETAQKKATAADLAWRQKEAEAVELRARLEELKKAVVQRIQALPEGKDVTWEILDDDQTRASVAARFSNILDQARVQDAATKKSVKRWKDLLQRQETTEKTRLRAIEDGRAAERQAAVDTAELAAMEARCAELRRRLVFADEQTARAAIVKQEQELAALREKIAAVDRKLVETERALSAAQASLANEIARRESCERLYATCREDFASVLAAEGYTEEARYRIDRTLLPAGMADAQRCLADWGSNVAAFREKYDLAVKTLDSLENETKDYSRRDAPVAQKAYEAAQAALEATGEQLSTVESFIGRHQAVLEKIRETDERLACTDLAMKRLNALALLASGGIGGGQDRLDFERYMLGDCLREVLRQANVRLDRMSGGRYELVHRAEGLNRQSAAGLDIDVLDHNTGRQRLSQTISGGEGFQASMALALGLADVVRNHAGHVQLDSTFIDEGFGSLDEDVLRKCLDVLKDLAKGTRQVGIISHVAELEANVWPQIVVTSDDRHGSSARIDRR